MKTREEIEKFVEEKTSKENGLIILILLDIKELLAKLVSKK